MSKKKGVLSLLCSEISKAAAMCTESPPYVTPGFLLNSVSFSCRRKDRQALLSVAMEMM